MELVAVQILQNSGEWQIGRRDMIQSLRKHPILCAAQVLAVFIVTSTSRERIASLSPTSLVVSLRLRLFASNSPPAAADWMHALAEVDITRCPRCGEELHRMMLPGVSRVK